MTSLPPENAPWKYFSLPLEFREPKTDSEGAMLYGADGQQVAMLFWPFHPPEETEAAEQETYRLGRMLAGRTTWHKSGTEPGGAHPLPDEQPNWLPLAKKLSAQLAAMGADIHPSKLEIWLERELAPQTVGSEKGSDYEVHDSGSVIDNPSNIDASGGVQERSDRRLAVAPSKLSAQEFWKVWQKENNALFWSLSLNDAFWAFAEAYASSSNAALEGQLREARKELDHNVSQSKEVERLQETLNLMRLRALSAEMRAGFSISAEDRAFVKEQLATLGDP